MATLTIIDCLRKCETLVVALHDSNIACFESKLESAQQTEQYVADVFSPGGKNAGVSVKGILAAP